MLLAQIEGLHVAPPLQVPEVEAVAVLAIEQQLRLHPGLDHARRTPLTADEGVVAEVPPEVVVQLLLAAVDLPAAKDIEGVVIEHEDATRSSTIRRTQGTDIDAVGSAVDGVPLGVPRLGRRLLRLDRLDDLGPQRVGLSVDDVETRGAEP